jgi:hypothetical protein
MFQALLQGRQIFKFGLLRKKDNKNNLKIRLVFNRMVVAFFPPYYSYTNPLATIKNEIILNYEKININSNLNIIYLPIKCSNRA